MGTYQQVAVKYGCTTEQVKQLQHAMENTWGTIAHDYISCFESEPEAYAAFDSEAEMIAEATIDADRIKIYSNVDLTWFYDMPAGMSRLELGEAAWSARSESLGRHSER